MAAPVYHKLAQALDTMPNGFPPTESGVELRLLEKIFTPEEADLFCDLRLVFETPEQVAERTGRPLEGLGERLKAMWHHGQLFGIDFGTTQVYRALPLVFGIYEFQLKRMDREMAELWEAYAPVFGKQFFQNKPQLMQIVPVEKKIEAHQEAMPYEKVSALIEKGRSFGVSPCICKQEKRLLDKGCDKPLEVCLGIAPVPGIFDHHPLVPKAITKAEAYEILRISEEAGLVHMTSNVAEGHYFICNCCGCCCGVLRSINELGIAEAVNSAYYAQIDPESCVSCGVCADERCQVSAIQQGDQAYAVITHRCIGCGLCATTCPSDAIRMVRKNQAEIKTPPKTEKEWFQLRGQLRA